MLSLCLCLLACALPLSLADKPAVAPAYEAPAPDSYGAPSQPVQVVQGKQAPDSYGSPVAAPLASQPDSYGSPAAPPVAAQPDSYGSPAAPPKQQYSAPSQAAAAPVGNQGYYYYYYPVRQSAPTPASSEDDDSIIGLVTALLTKKIVLVALGIGAFLVATAVGINISFGQGRSLARSFQSSWEYVSPYMTEDNLVTLVDFVNKSTGKFE